MSENSEGLFYQIFLRKWHPQPTIPCAMVIFTVIGVFFLILGIIITSFNQQIVEFKISSYDEVNGNCSSKSNKLDRYNQICSFEIELPQMDGPVFIFYELTNFYQNHRRYVKSKGNNQLAGLSFSPNDAKKLCDPIINNKDLYDYQKDYYIQKNGTYIRRSDANESNYKILNLNETAVPCGLIARSFFNDSFQIYDKNFNKIEILETGITWPNDVGSKFKNNDQPTKSWIDVQNEHFIVWMKTAGLPDFRKIWGKVSNGFESKTYKFVINNNYNPDTFGGSKSLILSTAGPFGGKNVFLGVAYLIAGSLFIIIAAFFWGKGKYGGKNYGRKTD